MVVDRVNNGDVESVLTALLELGKGHIEGRQCFLNFSLATELPEIEQFVLPVLVRGEDGQIAVFGLDELDHGGNLGASSLNNLQGIKRNNLELVHSEDANELVTDGPHFSAKHIFLVDDFDRGLEGERLEIVDKKLSALNVEEVRAHHERFVEGGSAAEVTVRLTVGGRVLLIHSWILM